MATKDTKSPEVKTDDKVDGQFRPMDRSDWQMLVTLLSREILRRRAWRKELTDASPIKGPLADALATIRVDRTTGLIQEFLPADGWQVAYHRNMNFMNAVVTNGHVLYIGAAKRNKIDRFDREAGRHYALKRAFLAQPMPLPAVREQLPAHTQSSAAAASAPGPPNPPKPRHDQPMA